MTAFFNKLLVSVPLEIGAPAMGIIVGWAGFERGRRVIGTRVRRRATRLHDDNRKEKEQFQNFEIHIHIKGNKRLKCKRPEGHFAAGAGCSVSDARAEFIASWSTCRVWGDSAPLRI